VGRKFILLLACSILIVYSGVKNVEKFAAAEVTVENARIATIAAIPSFCFLSMIITSSILGFSMFQLIYKRFALFFPIRLCSNKM
jgi:hypothetical protein